MREKHIFTPKSVKKRKIGKKEIGTISTTVSFVVIGTVFLVIGYWDSMLGWMKTTGLVLLILSALPIIFIAHLWISKRISE